MSGQAQVSSNDRRIAELDENIERNFEIRKRLGKGAYGIVWKVIDRRKNRTVALKKIFDAFRDETDAQRTYREIVFLRAFRHHPNVISMLGIYKASNNLDIYLVFEYMDSDLHNVIKKGDILKDVHKRFIMFQMLNAIKYLHSGNVIHRDLKPSNILIDTKCRLKVADFGLARTISPNASRAVGTRYLDVPDEFDNEAELTDYVATRWYRAPEILVASRNYTKGIDLWSLGCILAEMLRQKPLFQGTSTINQIEKIIGALPEVTARDISAIGASFGSVLLSKKITTDRKNTLDDMLRNYPSDAANLVKSLLVFDPSTRLTAQEALLHPYVERFSSASCNMVINHDLTPPLRDDVRVSVDEYRNKLYEMIEDEDSVGSDESLGPSRLRYKSRRGHQQQQQTQQIKQQQKQMQRQQQQQPLKHSKPPPPQQQQQQQHSKQQHHKQQQQQQQRYQRTITKSSSQDIIGNDVVHHRNSSGRETSIPDLPGGDDDDPDEMEMTQPLTEIRKNINNDNNKKNGETDANDHNLLSMTKRKNKTARRSHRNFESFDATADTLLSALTYKERNQPKSNPVSPLSTMLHNNDGDGDGDGDDNDSSYTLKPTTRTAATTTTNNRVQFKISQSNLCLQHGCTNADCKRELNMDNGFVTKEMDNVNYGGAGGDVNKQQLHHHHHQNQHHHHHHCQNRQNKHKIGAGSSSATSTITSTTITSTITSSDINWDLSSPTNMNMANGDWLGNNNYNHNQHNNKNNDLKDYLKEQNFFGVEYKIPPLESRAREIELAMERPNHNTTAKQLKNYELVRNKDEEKDAVELMLRKKQRSRESSLRGRSQYQLLRPMRESMPRGAVGRGALVQQMIFKQEYQQQPQVHRTATSKLYDKKEVGHAPHTTKNTSSSSRSNSNKKQQERKNLQTATKTTTITSNNDVLCLPLSSRKIVPDELPEVTREREELERQYFQYHKEREVADRQRAAAAAAAAANIQAMPTTTKCQQQEPQTKTNEIQRTLQTMQREEDEMFRQAVWETRQMRKQIIDMEKSEVLLRTNKCNALNSTAAAGSEAKKQLPPTCVKSRLNILETEIEKYKCDVVDYVVDRKKTIISVAATATTTVTTAGDHQQQQQHLLRYTVEKFHETEKNAAPAPAATLNPPAQYNLYKFATKVKQQEQQQQQMQQQQLATNAADNHVVDNKHRKRESTAQTHNATRNPKQQNERKTRPNNHFVDIDKIEVYAETNDTNQDNKYSRVRESTSQTRIATRNSKYAEHQEKLRRIFEKADEILEAPISDDNLNDNKQTRVRKSTSQTRIASKQKQQQPQQLEKTRRIYDVMQINNGVDVSHLNNGINYSKQLHQRERGSSLSRVSGGGGGVGGIGAGSGADGCVGNKHTKHHYGYDYNNESFNEVNEALNKFHFNYNQLRQEPPTASASNAKAAAPAAVHQPNQNWQNFKFRTNSLDRTGNSICNCSAMHRELPPPPSLGIPLASTNLAAIRAQFQKQCEEAQPKLPPQKYKYSHEYLAEAAAQKAAELAKGVGVPRLNHGQKPALPEKQEKCQGRQIIANPRLQNFFAYRG